jgi:hypothetical protein
LLKGNALRLPRQKEKAAETLGKIGAFGQIDKLLAEKGNTDFLNLGALALTQAELEQKDFVKLRDLLANESLGMTRKSDVITSLVVLVRCSKIEPKHVADVLMERLTKEKRTPVKHRIITALGEVGKHASEKTADLVAKYLVATLKSATNTLLMKQIEQGLASVASGSRAVANQVIEDLESLLKSEATTFKKTAAVKALQLLCKESMESTVRVVDVLTTSLGTEKDASVRDEIIIALGSVGGKSLAALETLISALKKESDSVTKTNIIQSLEKIGQVNQQTSERILAVFNSTKESDIDAKVRKAAEASLFALQSILESYDGQLIDEESDEYGGKYFKAYPYKFENGFSYRIDVMSKDFDAFLYLKKGGETYKFDDDGGESLNARLYFEPSDAEAGMYEVWATTFRPRAQGAYRVEIRRTKSTNLK